MADFSLLFAVDGSVTLSRLFEIRRDLEEMGCDLDLREAELDGGGMSVEGVYSDYGLARAISEYCEVAEGI
jgi:hypothetical protein